MQDKDKKKPKGQDVFDPNVPWVGPEVAKDGYSPSLEKDLPRVAPSQDPPRPTPKVGAKPKRTVNTSQLLANLEESLSQGRQVPGLFDNPIARAPYQLYKNALDYPVAWLQEKRTPGDFENEREQIGRLIPRAQSKDAKGLAPTSASNLEALLTRMKGSGADFRNRPEFIRQLEIALKEQQEEEAFYKSQPQEPIPQGPQPGGGKPPPAQGKSPIEPYASPYGRDRAEDFSADLDNLRRESIGPEEQAAQPSELDEIIGDLEDRAQPKELDLVSKLAVALTGFSGDPRIPMSLKAQLEGRAETGKAQDQLMQAKLARARMGSNERIAETRALAKGADEDDELVNLNRDLLSRKRDLELDPAYAPTRARVDLLRDKLRALGPTMDPEQLKALEAEYERQLLQLAGLAQKRQRVPK